MSDTADSGPVIDPIAGLRAFLAGLADGQYTGAELGEALDALVNTGPLDPIDDPAWAFVGAKLAEAAAKMDRDGDGLDIDDVAGMFSRDAAELRAAADRKDAKAAEAADNDNEARAERLRAKAAKLRAKADALDAGRS